MLPGERCYYQTGVIGVHQPLPETPGLDVVPEHVYRDLCNSLAMWNPARYEFRQADQKCINRVLNQNGMCSWEMMHALWSYILCQVVGGRVVYDWPASGRPTEVCEIPVGDRNNYWVPIYPVMQGFNHPSSPWPIPGTF